MWIECAGLIFGNGNYCLLPLQVSSDDAMQNIETLIRLPHVRMLAEQDRFLVRYREVMNELPVRGNLRIK